MENQEVLTEVKSKMDILFAQYLIILEKKGYTENNIVACNIEDEVTTFYMTDGEEIEIENFLINNTNFFSSF